jgi:hypothetical protein
LLLLYSSAALPLFLLHLPREHAVGNGHTGCEANQCGQPQAGNLILRDVRKHVKHAILLVFVRSIDVHTITLRACYGKLFM